MRQINNKTEKMLEIENKLGGDIEEILRAMYVDHAMTLEDISEALGIGYVTTSLWLDKAGIYSRRLKVDL